jgi:hypothetical protein
MTRDGSFGGGRGPAFSSHSAMVRPRCLVAPQRLRRSVESLGRRFSAKRKRRSSLPFASTPLLPLDDCLYALQATVPHLTHRCFQRHGISRLPKTRGDKPATSVCSGSGERPNFYRRLPRNRLDKSQSKKIRKYYFLELQDVPQSRDGNTSRRRRVEV